MNNNDNFSAADVLFARYSYHGKPFQSPRDYKPFQNYYIRWQVEGKCEARINSKAWQMIYPGDLLLFQPGDQCQLAFNPDKKTSQVKSGNYYIACQGDWIKNWWEAKERPLQAKVPINKEMLSTFLSISKEIYKKRTNWDQITSQLLKILLIYIDRRLDDANRATDSKAFIAHRMKQFIEENKSVQLKVEDVARHVGLSESRASHLFKEVYDISIILYSQEVRLAGACDLIRYTTFPLEQISYMSGFGSYTHFHRVFRKKYFMSPKDFRAEVWKVAPQIL